MMKLEYQLSINWTTEFMKKFGLSDKKSSNPQQKVHAAGKGEREDRFV